MTISAKDLDKARAAKIELHLRNLAANPPKFDLEFVTSNYIRLLEESFRAKNLKIAHECLQALTRLHFPPSLNKQVNKS
jgi:hypothetical protein